jgi:hypothetical protein
MSFIIIQQSETSALQNAPRRLGALLPEDCQPYEAVRNGIIDGQLA